MLCKKRPGRKKTRPQDPMERKLWDKFTRLDRQIRVRYKKTVSVPAQNVVDLYKRLSLGNPIFCRYCNKELTTWNISVDHYIPLHVGGAHSIENFRFCCKRCNYYKMGLMPDEWEDLLDALRPAGLLPYLFKCFKPQAIRSKFYRALTRERDEGVG